MRESAITHERKSARKSPFPQIAQDQCHRLWTISERPHVAERSKDRRYRSATRKEKSIEKSARSDCGNARRACFARRLLPWSLPNGGLGAARRPHDGAQDDRHFDPKS